MQFLRRITAPAGGGELTDGELLGRFMQRRDEDAFATLLRRHGAMVLAVCRGVLGDGAEAEDAFQATFLVLVRKAGSVAKPQSLASWLHGVAYRVAARARVDRARRRRREREAPPMTAEERPSDLVWRDLRPVLHEEIERLPGKYRVPFVLCHLEGMSNEEAARQLRCPKGTLQSNLSRAREQLRSRLARRGVTLSAAALGLALAGDAAAAVVPPELATAALNAAVALASGGAAAGTVAPGVAAMMKGAPGGALPIPAKLAAAVLVAVVAATGVAMALRTADSGRRAGAATDVAPSGDRAAAGPGGVAAAPTTPDSPPPRDPRLQGTWLCTEARFNDQRIDPGKLRQLRLVVSADRFAVRTVDGKELEEPATSAVAKAFSIEGPYRADPGDTPATLDVRVERAGAPATTVRGIYRLDDDALRVCYTLGPRRPAEFRSPKDSDCLFSVWKRQ
jgi:RNA polymerase sigma factor (sigma-70 family)